jgi:hypothetical protein
VHTVILNPKRGFGRLVGGDWAHRRFSGRPVEWRRGRCTYVLMPRPEPESIVESGGA